MQSLPGRSKLPKKTGVHRAAVSAAVAVAGFAGASLAWSVPAYAIPGNPVLPVSTFVPVDLDTLHVVLTPSGNFFERFIPGNPVAPVFTGPCGGVSDGSSNPNCANPGF